MRVHERGVGETRSCGTGICAAVVAAVAWSGGEGRTTPWTVDVPGGRLYGDLAVGRPGAAVRTGRAGGRGRGLSRRAQSAVNFQLWLPAAGSISAAGSRQVYCWIGAFSSAEIAVTSRHLPLCRAMICT